MPVKGVRLTTESDDTRWMRVIGRSLAFLCLAQAELRDKGLGPQAKFLIGLGLTLPEAAEMLGSSTESVRVLLKRELGQKGRQRAAKKR